MIEGMLRKDFQRNRIIAVTLFLFIMLAALSVSGAVQVIGEMFTAMESLFEKSQIPHFTQMHAEEIDTGGIERFTAEHEGLIESHQISELLNIDGGNMFLGNSGVSEAEDIQQNAFVKQNTRLGFLLGMDNQILRVTDGEIAVPIYHKQRSDLQIGDPVTVQSGKFSKTFRIAAFLRDAQMNYALAGSKRFLVSDNDWAALKENIGSTEYLIEFRLRNANNPGERLEERLGAFESLYLTAGMPQIGPTITYPLYRVLNSASDGIAAAVMVLVSMLLVMIAALCLRFTMIASIEEDYLEIGVMRAIGIHHKDIGKLYLTKYVVMAAAACICGYVLSFFTGDIFTANIALYMGEAEKNISGRLFPIAGAAVIFLAVLLFCSLILRRFRRISAAEAIRTGNSSGSAQSEQGGKIRGGFFRRFFQLCKSRISNVNVFLGLQEALGRFRVYGLLCLAFAVCTFLMILPLNMLNTIQSPEYITYMGIGRCDIVIGIQRTDIMEQRYNEILARMERDPDISRYAGFYTGLFDALAPSGLYESIRIESGDFSVFPLTYIQGAAPQVPGEIALSYMNADAFGKKAGDTLTVFVDQQEQHLRICGVYQDTTNAGKTAKAILPHNPETILWYSLYMDVRDGADGTPSVDISAKAAEYAADFYPAQVNSVEERTQQVMGGVIEQLGSAAAFAVGLALGIAALITAMFFKMLIAKETSQIAIMESIGFSLKDIQVQYSTRALVILLIGIVTGTVMAGTLGQKLAALIIPGASSIQFMVDPVTAYILCPGSLTAVVVVTLWLVMAAMKKRRNHE